MDNHVDPDKGYTMENPMYRASKLWKLKTRSTHKIHNDNGTYTLKITEELEPLILEKLKTEAGE